MSFRGTLVLALVALALGLYIYGVEIRGKRLEAEAEAASKKLFTADVEAVEALELVAEAGEEVRLVRDDDGRWQLEQPLSYPADAGVVSNLLGALGRLSSLSTIDELPPDLELFGLGSGRKSVRIWTGEEAPLELHLGGRAPIGSAIYLQRSDAAGRLFTVASGAASSLSPRLLALRDKRMLDVDVAAISALRILEHGVLVAAARRTPETEVEGGWRLTEPSEERADSTRIDRLLHDLLIARATGFVDEPAGLAEYGLAEPELELQLQLGEESRQVRIGRVQDKGYLQVDGELPVFETSDRVLMNMPRRFFSLRYKRVIEVPMDAVASIELRFPRDGTSHQLVKEDAGWSLEGSAREVNDLSVEDLLWGIHDLDATSTATADLEALGLAPPRVRVAALGAEGEELAWLELGDPTGMEISARSSSGEERWNVQSDLGEDIPLSEEAFERNFLLEVPDEAEPDEAEAD